MTTPAIKNRFFPMGIKIGDPISKRGLVEALIKMSTALDAMSVHNGHVDWTNDTPKIVIDKFAK
jgi:hypothetical protein